MAAPPPSLPRDEEDLCVLCAGSPNLTLRSIVAELSARKTPSPARTLLLLNCLVKCTLNMKSVTAKDEDYVCAAQSLCLQHMLRDGWNKGAIQDVAAKNLVALARFRGQQIIEELLLRWAPAVGQLPISNWTVRCLGNVVESYPNAARTLVSNIFARIVPVLGKLSGSGRLRALFCVVLHQLAFAILELEAEDGTTATHETEFRGCYEILLNVWIPEAVAQKQEELLGVACKAVGSVMRMIPIKDFAAAVEVAFSKLLELLPRVQLNYAYLVVEGLCFLLETCVAKHVELSEALQRNTLVRVRQFADVDTSVRHRHECERIVALLGRQHVNFVISWLCENAVDEVTLTMLRVTLQGISAAIPAALKGSLIMSVRPFVRGQKSSPDLAVLNLISVMAQKEVLQSEGGQEILSWVVEQMLSVKDDTRSASKELLLMCSRNITEVTHQSFFPFLLTHLCDLRYETVADPLCSTLAFTLEFLVVSTNGAYQFVPNVNLPSAVDVFIRCFVLLAKPRWPGSRSSVIDFMNFFAAVSHRALSPSGTGIFRFSLGDLKVQLAAWEKLAVFPHDAWLEKISELVLLLVASCEDWTKELSMTLIRHADDVYSSRDPDGQWICLELLRLIDPRNSKCAHHSAAPWVSLDTSGVPEESVEAEGQIAK